MVTDRRQKLLAELERNPKAVPPERLETALRAFGYERRPGKGSHRTYVKGGAFPITVPYKRPHLKRFYVEAVMARLRSELARDEEVE